MDLRLVNLRWKKFDELTESKIAFEVGVNTKYVKKFKLGDYEGFIILSRGSLMGSLIINTPSGYPYILRGYPKIHYLDKEILHFTNSPNPVYFEEKLNGTNLVVAYESLPTRCCGIPHLLVKTRMTPLADEEWQELLEECPYFDNLVDAVKDSGHQVVVELCGFKNPIDIGMGFGRYDEPIFYRVIDVVKIENLNFMDREEKEIFCGEYGLPIVDVEYALPHGAPRAELIRIAEELEKFCEDNMLEGVVAKVQSGEDQVMAKIKPEQIKEIAIKKAGGLPKHSILKAIQKTRENVGLFNRDEALSFIFDELAEDYDKLVIKDNWDRIQMYYEKERSKFEILEDVDDFLATIPEELLPNKGKVMRMLAERFGKTNSRLLFRSYQEFLRRMTKRRGGG